MRVVNDQLWSALGDPTRRRVLDLLLEGESDTPKTLSEHLPVSRQAISKHLSVLERAGLVAVRVSGRERHYRVNDAQLARASEQLRVVGAAWDARLARLKKLAEALQVTRDVKETGSARS